MSEGSIGASHFDVLQEDGAGPTLTQTPNAYNLLVRMDQYDPGVVLPELAERWALSQDGRSLTLSLRKGVKWHDGKPFTSADVAYSLDRMRNPKPGIISRRKAEFSFVQGIDTPNESTLVIRFKQPQPDFLANLGSYAFQIVPKHLAEPLDAKGEGMKYTLVGTGPFKIKAMEPDTWWEWQRNPEYFKPGLPYLDGLRYTYMKDDTTRVAALRTGRLHLGGSDQTADIKLLKEDPNIRWVKYPQNRFYIFAPSVDRPPFNDIRVRQAAALTINHKAWTQASEPVSPFSALGAGMMPGNPWALPVERLKKIPGYDFDADNQAEIKQAEELVKQAGYTGKVKIPLVTATLWTPNHIITAEQLSRGPFQVDVQLIDRGLLSDLVDQARNVAVTWSLQLKFMTADGALSECCSAAGRRNFGRYGLEKYGTRTAVDVQLEELFQRQSQQVDQAKRKEMVWDYQELWLRQYYHVHLGWHDGYAFWSKKLHNYWAHIYSYNIGFQEDRWLEQ